MLWYVLLRFSGKSLIFARMKRHYFLLLWVFGVVCLHRYAQSCGVGLTYDSQNYVWASNTWAGKGILQNHDGVPFLQQPPLFSLFLSSDIDHT
jgi:hypothetical protein